MSVTLIRAGLLTVSAGESIPGGEMLVQDGVIAAVGAHLDVPAEAKILDYSAHQVFPGFIDAGSHIGINKEPFNYLTESQDACDPSDPVQPRLTVEDGFDPFSPALDCARSFGVTSVFVDAGHGNLVDGQGAAYKLRRRETAAEMLIADSRQMNLTIGDLPAKGYSQIHRPPQTRPGSYAMLRNLLDGARKLIDTGKEDTADPNTAALLPVLKGTMRARLYVHSAQDIARAVELAESLHLNYILKGCYEAWKLPAFWKNHPVNVLLEPLPIGPMQNMVKGWYDFSLDNAEVLVKAGCRLALTANGATHTARLPYIAGFMSARGLTYDQALRAVTETAADFAGLSARTGSLQAGKDADFSVWHGDALTCTSECLATFVEGEPVWEKK